MHRHVGPDQSAAAGRVGLENPSPYGGFIAELFREFDEKSIRYCVLRNFEGLPERTDGDVDILVGPEGLPLVEAILSSLLLGFTLAWRRERDGHVQFMVVPDDEVRRAVRQNRPAEVIALDLQFSLQWMGMPYMDTNAVLSSRERRGSFYVATLEHMAAHLACHIILDKNFVKSEYKQAISDALTRDGQAAFAPLIPFLGKSAVVNLRSAFAAGDDAEILRTRRRLILSLLHRRRSIRDYLSFLRQKYARRARAILFPPGVVVATAGPDGSGKSTVSRRVAVVLSDAFTPVVERYMGGKQFVLPTKRLLRVFERAIRRRGAREDASGASDPLTSVPSWACNFSVLHYFADLWARYLFQIRPAQSRGGLVLCDRYFYDIFVRRVWVCENRWIRSLLLALTPRPSVILLLTGDAEVIAARKGENTADETARQLKEFAALRNLGGGVVVLDCENSLDDNVISAVEGVLTRSTRGVAT